VAVVVGSTDLPLAAVLVLGAVHTDPSRAAGQFRRTVSIVLAGLSRHALAVLTGLVLVTLVGPEALHAQAAVIVAHLKSAVLPAQGHAGVVKVAQQSLHAMERLAARLVHVEDSRRVTLRAHKPTVAQFQGGAIGILQALGTEMAVRFTIGRLVTVEELTLGISQALHAEAVSHAADHSMGKTDKV